jgi:hypothetical protein
MVKILQNDWGLKTKLASWLADRPPTGKNYPPRMAAKAGAEDGPARLIIPEI